MTIWNNKAFTENELSSFSKVAIILLLVVPVILITIQNVLRGEVNYPYAFIISLAGFGLFVASKISLFIKGTWISFGTEKLSDNMANLYRLGYWLMAVGLILTFVK